MRGDQKIRRPVVRAGFESATHGVSTLTLTELLTNIFVNVKEPLLYHLSYLTICDNVRVPVSL